MSARRWPGVVAVALLAGAVVGLGVTHPAVPARISTDRLGPDSGEQVPAYLERARATLYPGTGTGPETGTETEHWALMSLTEPVTTDGLLDLAGDLRVAQVLLRVPLDRVQTPVVAIPVAANPEAVRRAPAVAAARLQASVTGHDRSSLVAAWSAARLSGGCACVVGATVRGTLNRLQHLADTPGVRVVEALPSDAVAGLFAVSPLLPEQVSTVAPGPDDGPVPSGI